MRMMLNVQFPNEPFNSLVREGRAGQLLGEIFEELKPEAVYFTEQFGSRAGVFIIDVESPAQVPRFAEPFFLGFDASVEFRVVMGLDDLAGAGLDALGERWG